MTINLLEIQDSLGGDWWTHIRSKDFAFLKWIPDKTACVAENDDILIHKEMVVDEMGRKFPEILYHQVMDDEAFEIAPLDVRKVLAGRFTDYVNKFHILPAKCEYAKTFKNGTIAFNYKPTEYDKFHLKFAHTRIQDTKLGAEPSPDDVTDYLNNLTHAPTVDPPSARPKKKIITPPSGSSDPGDADLFQRVAAENEKGSVHVFGGKITQIDRETTTFQEEETVFYLLQVEGGSVAPDKKKSTLKRDFSHITARSSENAMEKFALEVGDKITFSGKMKWSWKFGWMVHNIRKFAKD